MENKSDQRQVSDTQQHPAEERLRDDKVARHKDHYRALLDSLPSRLG